MILHMHQILLKKREKLSAAAGGKREKAERNSYKRTLCPALVINKKR